jgi:hypothetical protein
MVEIKPSKLDLELLRKFLEWQSGLNIVSQRLIRGSKGERLLKMVYTGEFVQGHPRDHVSPVAGWHGHNAELNRVHVRLGRQLWAHLDHQDGYR